MSGKRLFRYYPEDFTEPPVTVRHMDLVFDVFDEHTTVTSRLHAETRDTPLSVLRLNAKNLVIEQVGSDRGRVAHAYDEGQSILSVSFDPPIPPRTAFSIDTVTVCRPSTHVLEGLYYDETPAGAPPTQITQCQQWGFQRIVPCIDDMTAKCTYRTTIIADDRYTNLISNGDIAVPRHPAGGGRDAITYDNTITPMAPYLFFLGVGTYATYSRPFEYPDGTACSLELLVPPDADAAAARIALDVLADAILWVYLYTGPECYEKRDLRGRMAGLCRERDAAIAAGKPPDAISAIRASLAALSSQIRPGYAYTGTVYREIGMQNSDFGGMENVGNTTISTNRIMPFAAMTDPAFEYMVRVKVHEFYHNLNGSEVTGQSPFTIWLNEAVTVHIEHQYHAHLFGEAYSRLQTVLTLLSPDGGTLSYDRGAGSLPIEPAGFNDPNDLITGVTYVKAPECVRMIETLIGRERFAQGLSRYHERYRHGNATREQWIEAMEEVSGVELAAMADTWLKQRGYPELEVTAAYDRATRSLVLRCVQHATTGDAVWEFPFSCALCRADGSEIASRTVRIAGRDTEIRFDGVEEPAFLSLNRGYSFYGTVRHAATDEALRLQLAHDSDPVGRFLALHAILDREKMRLLDTPGGAVSPGVTSCIIDLLSDTELMAMAGGQFVAVFESVENEAYAHRYRDLYAVKRALWQAVADRHGPELWSLYDRYSGMITDGSGVRARLHDIPFRQVRNLCVAMLATLDTPAVHRLLEERIGTSVNASDRLSAFAAYLPCSAPGRAAVIDRFAGESSTHPVAWETFLAAIAGSGSGDTLDLVRKAESLPAFRIEQANDQRALYGGFARNRKFSLQTEEGRQFLQERLIRLARVNEYTTVIALSVFGALDKMDPEDQVPLVGVLADMLTALDGGTPAVCNTIRRLLIGAPGAVARYEAATGRRPAGIPAG
ncbi:MAG: M1 family metallopeptidase [Methanomicrobiales archaeon]|nr:M1 family metallopeptidase [Methanomicrobiales archaeon]